MSHYHSLPECLEWEPDPDFGVPMPSKLLNQLKAAYDPEIQYYIQALKQSAPEERKAYYPQIFETLYAMAEHDDADSIEMIFQLCPDICREGYYSFDQYLPLGEAILHDSYQAIEAFLANGVNIKYATLSIESTIGFAVSNDCRESTILFLLEKGAALCPEDILTVWLCDENRDLAARMIHTAVVLEPEDGIKGFIRCAKTLREEGSYWTFDFSLFSEAEKNALDELILYLEQLLQE